MISSSSSLCRSRLNFFLLPRYKLPTCESTHHQFYRDLLRPRSILLSAGAVYSIGTPTREPLWSILTPLSLTLGLANLRGLTYCLSQRQLHCGGGGERQPKATSFLPSLDATIDVTCLGSYIVVFDFLGSKSSAPVVRNDISFLLRCV
ncbi:hypothetical protein RRG08_056205 [Elysia crispata]|uniref:Uncharacterized protein n=1 Tax=Elysia crispata TaxID=231223 RepID=A0AAE1D0K1_9GAST|nr:hypothetical protein RRG08_056205 [Elysia crispata]